MKKRFAKGVKNSYHRLWYDSPLNRIVGERRNVLAGLGSSLSFFLPLNRSIYKFRLDCKKKTVS